jgi:hypothetical protein
MNQGSDEDGTISDIPWASVFDPVVNVRALGEIQARGFRAATDLVDRFVRSSSVPKPESSAEASNSEMTTETPTEPGAERPALDAEQLLGAWQRILGQAVQSVRGVGAQSGDAAVDFMQSAATGHIDIHATEVGTVSAEVWLHNSGSVDLGKVRLRCGDLLAHDGASIPSAAVRFDPDPVDMAARSSRGVTVEVEIGDDVRPGRYRGVLLADGHPDIWLPLALNVLPATP